MQMKELQEKFRQKGLGGTDQPKKEDSKQSFVGNKDSFANAKKLLQAKLGGGGNTTQAKVEPSKEEIVGNKQGFSDAKKQLEAKLGGAKATQGQALTTSAPLPPPPPSLPSLDLPPPPPPPSLPSGLDLPPPPPPPALSTLLPPPTLPPPPVFNPAVSAPIQSTAPSRPKAQTSIKQTKTPQSQGLPLPSIPKTQNVVQAPKIPKIENLPPPPKIQIEQISAKQPSKQVTVSSKPKQEVRIPEAQESAADRKNRKIHNQSPNQKQETREQRSKDSSRKPKQSSKQKPKESQRQKPREVQKMSGFQDKGADKKAQSNVHQEIFDAKPCDRQSLSRLIFGVDVAGYFKSVLMSHSNVPKNVELRQSKTVYDFNFPSMEGGFRPENKHTAIYFCNDADVVSCYLSYDQQQSNKQIKNRDKIALNAFKKKLKIESKPQVAIGVDWNSDDPKIRELKHLKEQLSFISAEAYLELDYGKIRKIRHKIQNIIKKYEREREYMKCEEYKRLRDKVDKLYSSFWAESPERKAQIKKQVEDIMDQVGKV